jgi:hypothetical protein
VAALTDLAHSRFHSVAANVLKLATTLALIALPRAFWFPIYVLVTFPMRLLSCLSEVVELGGLSDSQARQ